MAKSVAERQRDYRARKKLAQEQASAMLPKEQEIENALDEHAANLSWAQEFDATGKRYKSECRKLVDLLAIYEGANILDMEDEDEEETDKRKKTKKKEQNRPIPFKHPFKIRATKMVDDSLGQDFKVEVPIDPDTFEYKKLNGEVVNCKLMYEVDGTAPVSFRRWLDLRDKYRKDLFALGRLLGCSLFHNTHQVICDMFVVKNFDGMYFDEYTKDDVHTAIGKQQRFANDGTTPTRTMLLFAPRSGYKSTIDGLDVVQWLLNCPDARIMIMTNVKNLARMFMMEIKSYFYLPKRGTPTAFQTLFPEYVLTGINGKSKEPFMCPARTFNSKENHVWITSMDSSSTGSRCDIRKMDDIVDDKNSADEELRESLKEKVKATNNLVEGWGFTDIIGTRYFTKDWYGWRMSKDEHGNDPEPYAYLSISAWTSKPEHKTKYDYLLSVPNGIFDVTEDMVDLWFPSKLSFARLRSLLKENKERGFKNQQLNIATDPQEIDDYVNQFDMDVLRAHLYQPSAVPKEMEIIQSWDTAYSDKSTSDFSVGSTLGIYRGKDGIPGVVVLDVVYDKWKSSELAYQMIDFHKKHRPSAVFIEDVNGTGTFLDGDLRNASRRYGSDIAQFIRRRPVSLKPNAKRSRIMDLEFLLANDRLWFVVAAWNDMAFKQLTEYRGGKSTAYRKDDIPDSVALGVTSHLPPSALKHDADPKDVEKEHEEMQEKARREAWKNRMFGGHNPTKPNVAPVEPTPPPRDSRQELMKKLVGKILPPGMRL